MTLKQGQAPIVEALTEYLRESYASFGVPGHKGGKGAPSDIYRLLGKYAFYADTTTQHGIDDRTESKKIVHKAETLAARAWGGEALPVLDQWVEPQQSCRAPGEGE